MARPGLEPGTPRFSVVRSRALGTAQLLENKRFLRRARIGWKFALCGLLRAFREMPAPHLLFPRHRCSSAELGVRVAEDDVDLELAAERFDVALQGGDADVQLLL